MESETLYNQPVVIDNGSGNLKAGFAGEDKPKAYASAIIGRPKYQKIMAGSLISSGDDKTGEDTFIGDIAQQNRGLLRLSYPIEHGIVNNWDDMEKLWYHTYTQDLKTNAEEHPLLITEAPLNPRINRDKMCQIYLNCSMSHAYTFQFKQFYRCMLRDVISGVVIDSGDGVSHIILCMEDLRCPRPLREWILQVEISPEFVF